MLDDLGTYQEAIVFFNYTFFLFLGGKQKNIGLL